MGVDVAISLVLALIDRAATISALIQKAQTEKRALTEAEWQSVIDADNAARSALATAIENAKSEGR